MLLKSQFQQTTQLTSEVLMTSMQLSL